VDKAALEALDQKGYTVLEALTHVKAPPKASHSTPHLFACEDGKGYWVKSTSQHGLTAELVAGRLAARCGAGPTAAIIRVTPESVGGDPSLIRFEGVIVGSLNHDGAVNDRDLGDLGITTLDAAQIDSSQRAKVVAFQSWLGLGDLQLLLDMRTGKIMSFDHGECFGDTTSLTDPSVQIADLPGIPPTHGNEADDVSAAVDEIESVSDHELLGFVSGMPVGGPWQSDIDRRLRIAEWLAHRRDKLREVMKQWL
jgi:hypothetical protein